MDASAQLALMIKAKLVFEGDEDTFLSFPALSPLSFPPEQLQFVNPSTGSEMLAFSQFCMLTNALPGEVLFEPDLDNVLWEVYLNVLKKAQLASGTLTPEQQASYQQAEAFLWVQGSNGLPAASASVIAYDQYRQTYLTALQNFKAAQLTASASADPSVQAQWQNIDGPALQSQVDSAMNDWETKGFKAQVESQRQVEQTCIAASPGLQWQTWVSLCNPEIDFLTDGNNQTFAPTVYSPYDILAQTNWPTFTLSGSEVQQLISQAPAELTNVLGEGSGTTDITSLSFEFASVGLSRPWFTPEVFAARFWQFTDGSEPLSDGNVPPRGSWPAYITGLVFARNIVETKAAAPAPRPVPTFPQILWRTAPPPAPPPPPHPLPEPVVRPAAPVFLNARMMPRLEVAPPPVQHPVVPPATVTLNPAIMSRLSTVAFRSVVPPAPIAQQAPANASAAPSQSTSGTQVSILAFICKRLGKCPNPDPSFNWGATPTSSVAPGPSGSPSPAAGTSPAQPVASATTGTSTPQPVDAAAAATTSQSGPNPSATPATASLQ